MSLPSQIMRYQAVVPCFSEFVDSLSHPLPTTFWINTLRLQTPDVLRLVDLTADELKPLVWRNDAYRFLPQQGLGARAVYQAGFIHIQEEVAMIPAIVLGPEPGDHILDLCAAPGNKAVQMAVLTKEKATIIANDASANRLKVVALQVGRLGLGSIVLSHQNGLWFAAREASFDRILVDAPCSSEGTHRKNSAAFGHGLRDGELFASGLQVGLLARAFHLLKPGGIMVYATCTYRPEENEVVIDRILNRFPELNVLPIDLDGLIWEPGLRSWLGRSFQPSVQHCMRLWSHRNDTGGFFVAKLQKQRLCD